MSKRPILFLIAVPALLGATACNSGPQFQAKTPTVEATKRVDGTIDDHSLCDWKGHADREASEVAGPGSIQPNVRRVYQILGTGEDRHKILICREIDTNFDGVKDVVRHYNDKGESISEEADANYDGRLDTWITFIKGRLAEVKLDTNFDGKVDTWKYYTNGKLTRVVRDSNFDGKPDVWEIYRDGHLERMGVDVDGDEHVDRWDHDTEMRRRFEDAERKKEADDAAKAEKKAAAERANDYKVNEDADKDAKTPPESLQAQAAEAGKEGRPLTPGALSARRGGHRWCRFTLLRDGGCEPRARVVLRGGAGTRGRRTGSSLISSPRGSSSKRGTSLSSASSADRATSLMSCPRVAPERNVAPRSPARSAAASATSGSTPNSVTAASIEGWWYTCTSSSSEGLARSISAGGCVLPWRGGAVGSSRSSCVGTSGPGQPAASTRLPRLPSLAPPAPCVLWLLVFRVPTSATYEDVMQEPVRPAFAPVRRVPRAGGAHLR